MRRRPVVRVRPTAWRSRTRAPTPVTSTLSLAFSDPSLDSARLAAGDGRKANVLAAPRASVAARAASDRRRGGSPSARAFGALRLRVAETRDAEAQPAKTGTPRASAPARFPSAGARAKPGESRRPGASRAR
jgi:hypothetical protein